MRRLSLVLAATVVVAVGVSFARSRPAPRVAARRPAGPPSLHWGERRAWPLPGPPAPAAPGAPPARRYYHGTVLDAATGTPVEGATVRLCRRPGGGAPTCGKSLVVAESEEDGYFVLQAPEREVADGEQSARVREEPLVLEAAADRYGPIVAAPSEPERRAGVALALRAEARVAGRLVLRTGGAPELAEYGWRRPGGEPAPLEATTDGSFEIRGLPEGEVIIHAVAGESQARRFAGAARVWLRAGERRALDLVLDEAVYLAAGRLVDAEGRPVARASVTAAPERDGDVEALLAWLRDDAETDSNGRFVLELAGPGPHRVGFRLGPDHEPAEVAVASLAARPLVPGQEPPSAEVRVTRPDVVACTLLDASGRATGVSGGSVFAPSGGWGWARGGCGAAPARTTMHFLWPRAGGPVTVRLGGPVGQGYVTLRGPAERCEIVARVHAVRGAE